MSGEIEPFFSIVIPSYNRAGTIERAVNSCLLQTFGALEVIVADDGSKDNTAEVMARIDDPRVIYEWRENAGAGAARNRGAARARGRCIAFLDADDEFLPGKLAAFHALIASYPGDAENTVFYSPLFFHRGERNRMVKPSRPLAPGERVGDYLFAFDGMMQTSTLVIPAPLFARVQFDPQLRNHQDLDLCLHMEEAGAAFAMLPDPQVIWYDETDTNRVSYSIKVEQKLAWVEAHRHLLSDKAYAGFMARYVVPGVIRTKPAQAMQLLSSAVRHGAVSGSRAASLFMRGAMPGVYGRLRDALVTLRGS